MLLKNYKRCLSFVLALALILSLIPMSALAAEEDPNGQVSADTAAEVSEPAEETTISTETSKPPSEPEEVKPAAIEEIQARINAVLTQYGITAEMSDREIGNAIIPADGDTVQATMAEMSAIEDAAWTLTEAELAQLDTELYSRFCAIMEQLFNPVPVTTLSILDGQVSVTDTQNTLKNASGTLTATAKGGMLSKKTNTITITNKSASVATLSFDYTVEKANSFTIDGASATTTGSVSKQLNPDASVTIAITSNSGFSNLTVTLTLSNFAFTAAAATSNVTFEFDSSKGSVSVDGTAITSGTTKELTATTGAAVAATPKSTDYTFLGWINKATGKIQDTPDGKFIPTENMTLKAVFVAKASDTGWFLTSGTHLFDNLTNANNWAKSAANKTIILANNGTLSGSHEISSGVTLLIPRDDVNTLNTTQPDDDGNSSYTVPTVYRKLTMAQDAKITVNGAISIGGKIGTYMVDSDHPGQPPYTNGAPSGPLGYIDMAKDSAITVNNDGNLYAWGFITGSGAVTVKSGGNVYEDLQIRDYRGGNGTTQMIENKSRVFPFTQYYVQNIEVPLTLEAGATESVCMAVSVSYLYPQKDTSVFIGQDKGLIRLSSGSITRTYVGSEDRIVYDLNGTVSFANLNVNLKVELMAGSITIDSEDYVMPINSNMTLNINTGSSVTLTQDLALLPGSIVTIAEGATCTMGTGNKLFVYDQDDWPVGYVGITGAKFSAVYYAPGRGYNRTAADLIDAELCINGTLDATNGYVYTTSGNANVHSTGKGKLIVGNKGDTTATYQAKQSGTEIKEYTQIPVTLPVLKHEDRSELQTAANTTYNHDHYTCLDHGDTTTDSTVAKCGTWYAGSHGTATDADLPTYQKTGKTATCTCGHGGDVLPKVVQQAAIAASADSEIILDVKFWLPEEFENDTKATVTVTFRDEEPRTYAVNELAVDNNRYVITQSIASGEMTCPVDITFRSGDGTVVKARSGNAISDSLSKSVVDYAKLVLENGTDQQKALITNLLTYGGYSQVKFGVDADNPAYKLLEEKGIGVPDVANTAISVTESDTVTAVSTITGSITGLTVSEKNQAYLDSAIYFRLYFTLTEGSIKDYSVSYRVPVGNRDTVATSLKIEPDTENNRYYVDIPDIPSGYLDYPYKVTFSKGSETLTVQTSVLAYLKRLVDNGAATTDEKNLAKAMYLYNQAANTFFNK